MLARNLSRRKIKPCFPAIAVILAFVFCICGLSRGLAQVKKEENVKRVTVNKEITGELVWLGKERIAVTFSSDKDSGDEREMLLPYDSDVRIEHKKSLSEISVGDTVRVQYEEVTEKHPDSSSVLTGRKAKVIGFVRAKEKKPEEGNVLRSE